MQRQFSTRFVERSLNEKGLTGLCRAVNKDNSRRKLSITDTGLAMLSSIVDLDIPESVLPVLGSALQDILEGRGGVGSKNGNLFTGSYGEMIGPLLTCMERGGDFEVIRISETEGGKEPDFLIVDKGSGKVIILECKGCCITADDRTVRLDACGRIGSRRNNGKPQLTVPSTNAWSGRRIGIKPVERQLARLLGCDEKCIAVTAIPDGRLDNMRNRLERPNRKACPQPCTEQCLYTPEPHMITALFSESLCNSRGSGGSASFISDYKATERAAWGRAHGCFSKLYCGLLSSYTQLARQNELPDEGISLAPFLAGPLQYAAKNRVFMDVPLINSACSESLTGAIEEMLMRTVSFLAFAQERMHRPDTRRSSPRELHEMLFGTEESSSKEDQKSPVANWIIRARRPQSDERHEGTVIEAQISECSDGCLDMRLVTAEAAANEAADDIQWALAEIIGGDYASEVYQLFDEETVSCTGTDDEDARQFVLGRSLSLPWWPWPMGRAQLRTMRRSGCAWCNDMAHIIEMFSLHMGFDLGYLLRHNTHHHHGEWSDSSHLTAFVTADARGVLRLPNRSH